MTLTLSRWLASLALVVLGTAPAVAADLTIAAASDLRFALDEVLAPFRQAHPGRTVDVVYGASGKLSTQIRHGAPFDVFLSADVAFPRALQAEGLTAGPVQLYAVGRLVLWSRDAATGRRTLADLAADPAVRKFAIANPRHAPYGQRAVEALQHAGVWDSDCSRAWCWARTSRRRRSSSTAARPTPGWWRCRWCWRRLPPAAAPGP